jgi:Ni/Fe-hydrogenase b-type cytochrome subunit
VSATAPAVVTDEAGRRHVYEHPWAVRMTHWVNAVCVIVLALSGLRIFAAFPSFGPKVPERDLFDPTHLVTLGGWLGGALQWHFTFMWIFMGAGLFYAATQLATGHYRTLIFVPRDIAGVWPMARHYFLFGPKPPQTEQYNPLQKLAYTITVLMGALSMATGLILYKPAQLSGLAWMFGGFHWTRIWHFGALCGFAAFIPGHLIMVALHGWTNFTAMLTGWKREPEYLPPRAPASPPAPPLPPAPAPPAAEPRRAEPQEPADAGPEASSDADATREPAAPMPDTSDPEDPS